jgi:hypothetical protein
MITVFHPYFSKRCNSTAPLDHLPAYERQSLTLADCMPKSPVQKH